MGYISWHYSSGVKFVFKKWTWHVDSVIHYFSFRLLLKTLFYPWRRVVVDYNRPGFNFKLVLDAIIFNVISRGIGAVVRILVFIAGAFILLLVMSLGLIFALFAVIIPVFTYSSYQNFQKRPDNYFKELMVKAPSDPAGFLKFIFANEMGDFFLLHVGINIEDLLKDADVTKLIIENVPKDSFKDLVEHLVQSGVWSDDFFRKYKTNKDDFVLCAAWWESQGFERYGNDVNKYTTPGLASELLFGYTPELDKYVVDLRRRQDFTERLIGRQNIVKRIERVLSSGKSIVLTGQPGVGKKTVVLEFAKRATVGELGMNMSYTRILEFDYNFLLAEAVDVNAKKAELSKILSEASLAGNIVMVIRDIHRLTNFDVENYDFTDIFESALTRGTLKIISIISDRDYERFVVGNIRLKKLFEPVEVTAPTGEEAMQILLNNAGSVEEKKGIVTPVNVARKVLEDSDKYITETPYPEKALELLDAAIVYKVQNGGKVLTLNDVDVVLSEKTGVSFTRLTSQEKTVLTNLEKIIHERLVDQEVAIDLIAKTIRAKTVGVVKEKRPLGSFLFLGPTGVGKTETAKVLARVYYGSEASIVRFDMAEFSGREGLERLTGSVTGNLPGVLTSAIKNRPASLLLLDEIEKSSPEVFNLFLSLLDEGEMKDAFGKKILGKHLFIIGTSNAGAEYVRELVSQGVMGEELQKKVVEHILKERIFSPEFLNRFDGVVVYEPLRDSDLVRIASFMLSELAGNLKEKRVNLVIDDSAVKKLAVDGYEPAFGARPMKRIVNLHIGDVLSKAMLEGKIAEGDSVKLLPGTGKDEFIWEKTK